MTKRKKVHPAFVDYDTSSGTGKLIGDRVRTYVDAEGSYIEIKPIPGGIEVYYAAYGFNRLIVIPHVSNVVQVIVDRDAALESRMKHKRAK